MKVYFQWSPAVDGRIIKGKIASYSEDEAHMKADEIRRAGAIHDDGRTVTVEVKYEPAPSSTR